MDPRYNVVSNLSLPTIDYDEQEVDDLDIVTKPIMAWTKEWVKRKVAKLKQQGVVLMYEGLESEPNVIEDVVTTTSTSRTSKSPLITRSKKRKEIEVE